MKAIERLKQLVVQLYKEPLNGVMIVQKKESSNEEDQDIASE